MRRDERGNAMVAMILVTAIAALSTVAALTVAGRALHQGELGRRSSGARALADAAAGRALSELTSDPSYTTHDGTSVMDRAWVLTASATAPVEAGSGGEISWIVPDTEQVAFGVGFVPTRVAPIEIEIVRVTYERVDPSGFGAISTASSLDIDGGADILGLAGDVHANGDLDVTGSAWVSGDATATGSFTRGPAATVGGTSGGGYPAALVPTVSARSYRSLTDFDLCPDATVRVTGPGDPCAGAVAGTGLLAGWNGWSYTGSAWSVTGSTPDDVSVYVYRSSVTISGSPGSASDPWLLTVVAEGLSGGTLTSGDITLTGGAYMRPYTSGVGFVAERDLQSSGGAEFEGLVLAGEQVSLSGSGEMHGQVIASGTGDSPGSPVGANRVGGSFQLTAESTAPQVTGGVEPTDWRQI